MSPFLCCCLQVPTSCPGVPAVLLQPSLQWADKADFNETLAQLANLFVGSFRSYLEDAALHVGAEMAERILTGGPDLQQIQEAMAAAAAAEPHHHTEVAGHTALPSEGEGDSDVPDGDAHDHEGACKACGAKRSAAAAPAPAGSAACV